MAKQGGIAKTAGHFWFGGERRSMTKTFRRIWPFDTTASVVIALLLLGACHFIAVGPAHRSEPPAIPANPSFILDGLPSDAVEANSTFRARAFAQFPLLSPEVDLVTTLGRQGFVSDGWFSTKRMTYRRGGRRGCGFSASVTWEADSEARITRLEPRFLGTPECF